MKQLAVLPVLLLAFSIALHAQDKKKLDQNAIKNMCGCYEVTFNFTETFNYSQDSLYKPSETKVDKGLEWAQLVEDSDDKIVIQHLLQVGTPESPYIVKHWRQDWLFENTDFYMFNGDNQWTYVSKSKDDVKNQWTQKVYQVDDSPRYEGSATWVHVDGKSFWENTTTAPLPRREYTKRSDYNITLRGNRHQTMDYGWVHDQDNEKIIREAGKEDVVLAKEKGYNTYVKVDDSKCQAAQDWWKEGQEKWAKVRTKWASVFARHQDLALEAKVDNKVLFKYLFDDENYSTSEQIDPIIERFIKKQI
ncbi:DUF6607 family protein [Olleya namhaensis]|uniref:DKNYY family protein n=1 Tax=Olleya namhaensis TaxID=1144750 RepID=A0A1I3J720_9FLAO|nr:DUF6607 family protein [Olleya namhaensis]SFI55983.1 hypothetical protein SAMN05443431_101280 [Olleya namhaensis]